MMDKDKIIFELKKELQFVKTQNQKLREQLLGFKFLHRKKLKKLKKYIKKSTKSNIFF